MGGGNSCHYLIWIKNSLPFPSIMIHTKFSEKEKSIKLTIFRNISGVYQIQSKINGKIYVGSSINMYNRIYYGHLYELRTRKHGNYYLQNHYNKYGEKDLTFSILTICPNEKLIEQEQYWIDTLKPEFNKRLKAENCLGFKHTEETCQKHKDWYKNNKHPMLGKHHSEETKLKIGMSNKGVKPSEETIEKRRIKRKGYVHSEETKRKIGDANKKYVGAKNSKFGVPMLEETKEKLRQINLGHFVSEETKLKISITLKNRNIPISIETKNKMRERMTGDKNPFKGKKHTTEAKLKMSIAAKNRFSNKKGKEKHQILL
jgi:group I intron endonuclease